MDILQQSALIWKELTEYRYLLTYGFKKVLYPLNLSFSLEDYPHLAGFQYLKDISLPNYTSKRIADRILEGKIQLEKIQEAQLSNYLIASHIDIISYVFIIQATPDGEAKCDYLCCSAFKKDERDYETNQRFRALLKKERIHISTNTSTILLDKLTPRIEAKEKKTQKRAAPFTGTARFPDNEII